MAKFDVLKTFLKEQHTVSVTWHHVFNNTTSTRPKSHGGPVVPSITDLKQYEQCGASFATPMQRCVLRLPHSFNAGDGKVVEIAGIGRTQKEASEEACLGIMVKLLSAEPHNVLLRPAHWKVPTAQLLAQVQQMTAKETQGTEH